MSRFVAASLAVAAAFSVASCAGATQPALTSPVVEQTAQTTRPDLVILVSIDGFSRVPARGAGVTPAIRAAATAKARPAKTNTTGAPSA